MPTNDERRKVAARLRKGAPIYKRKGEYPDMASGLVAITGASINSLFGRLADLIEPEPERTCRIVEDSRKYVLSDGTELFEGGCSECGGYLEEGDNYCPNCGAKVMDE